MFDPAVLQPETAVPFETSETLSLNWILVHNVVAYKGRIGVAATTASGDANGFFTPTANGMLLKLRFKVIGNAGDSVSRSTRLTFAQTPVFEDNFGALVTVTRRLGKN